MGYLDKLLAAVVKEGKLLLRDREALLILFGMPVAFVLIMSLALRDSFHERAGVTFSMLIVDQDRDHVGKAITESFSQNKHFAVEIAETPVPDEAEVKEALRKGRYKFALLVPPKATVDARRRVQQQLGMTAVPKNTSGVDIRLLADPSIRGDQRAIVLTALNRALQGIETGLLLQQFGELAKRMTQATAGMPGAPKLQASRERVAVFDEVADEHLTIKTPTEIVPTSVQQNAPAWTLLAMFFLVIPITTAIIKERQQGGLMRLKSMPVPAWILFAGKVAPYFVINQIQVVLILLEGMYLLPRFGGDALVIGDSPGGIALLSASASLAAIGYGLLVASLSRTQEQANAFGAISVLILAAIGGIMVPKMVMPPLMQQLSAISPLAWGLDGFLDIFLRAARAADVLPRALQLLAFAAACFALAVIRFQRDFRHN